MPIMDSFTKFESSLQTVVSQYKHSEVLKEEIFEVFKDFEKSLELVLLKNTGKKVCISHRHFMENEKECNGFFLGSDSNPDGVLIAKYILDPLESYPVILNYNRGAFYADNKEELEPSLVEMVRDRLNFIMENVEKLG